MHAGRARGELGGGTPTFMRSSTDRRMSRILAMRSAVCCKRLVDSVRRSSYTFVPAISLRRPSRCSSRIVVSAVTLP